MDEKSQSVRQKLTSIIKFPYWWYFYNPVFFWAKFLPRTFLMTWDFFSLSSIIRVIFKPYRLDKTWVGYFMGIITRLVWILISLFMVFVTSCCLITTFILYLTLPFIFLCLVFEKEYRFYGIIGLVLTYLAYYVNYLQKTHRFLDKVSSFTQLQETFLPEATSFYKQTLKKEYNLINFWDTIYQQKSIKQYLTRLGLNTEEELGEIRQFLKENQASVSSWEDILWEGLQVGLTLNRRHLSCELIFLGWVQKEEVVERILNKKDLEWEHLREASQWMYAWQLRKRSWHYWEDRFFRRRTGVDTGWASGWMRQLKNFSVDITDLVKRGQVNYLVGRKELLSRVMDILQQTTRNNVLIVGPPGVGKTTLAYGIASKIINGEVPSKIENKKLIRLDLGALLSGTSGRGDMEYRVQEALKEIRDGNSILFIDEIHSLIGAGGTEGLTDVASFLTPVLTTGNIQLIATTNPENYRRNIESNSLFANSFQTVNMDEPPTRECIQVLEGFVPQMEADQGVKITFPAIVKAVELTQKFVHDRYLPGKAIELLDETAVSVNRQGKKEVNVEDIATVLANKTGIPLKQMNQNEKDVLMNLENLLHQRIVDQEPAIAVVSNALRRARSGLSPDNRPIASFLFVGPTGVGKTETAKALSAVYFGDEKNMIRLDMTEYSRPGQMYRLIGAPPGQPGYEEGGYLTEAVRSRPFAVILLDEIEKAHPEIHNLLLQVLDDGRLTDGSGKTIDFTNTMVICTSNAFSNEIQNSINQGISIERIQEKIRTNLSQIFRPELINRFDGVIVFRTLTREHTLQITQLLLNKLSRKIKNEHKIEIRFDPQVVQQIAELGYDPQFGARPLRRVIQQRIEDKIALKLIQKELEKGNIYTITPEDL